MSFSQNECAICDLDTGQGAIRPARSSHQKLKGTRYGGISCPWNIRTFYCSERNHSWQVEIVLVLRSSSMLPDEAKCEQTLETFRQELAAVFDWDTA